MKVQGHLCIVLHAHLPFVRHPEFDDFLEEDWLYEAITETYLPLLEMLDGLERDGIDYRLSMSISPTLTAMLSDSLLQQRYVRHIDKLIDLTGRETERTRFKPAMNVVANMYYDRFLKCREQFVNQHGCQLLSAFRRHYETGRLELLTCAATHGFLPLILDSTACWAQIEIGCREFERHFGRRPRGIWLPECGYAPGIDLHLRDSGLEYFCVDTHGILFADPRPRFGVYSPIVCPNSGVAVFGRDAECGKQVWSSIEGYPGSFEYRDFYRDIGFDLDLEYLKPYMHRGAGRTQTGVKYFRITGRTNRKQIYDPQSARERAIEHAEDFVAHRVKQVEWLRPKMKDRPALIVAPYDAELFGHWWYEGPIWLDAVLRKLHSTDGVLSAIGLAEYIEHSPPPPSCQPAASSWGQNGYHEVWLDNTNDWIYPHLHCMAERMGVLARRYPNASGMERRALNQAARELLLAQASDWAFIMKHGTTSPYAVNRTKTHILNFNHLYDQLISSDIDEPWLREIENRHNCFPTIEYSLYS